MKFIKKVTLKVKKNFNDIELNNLNKIWLILKQKKPDMVWTITLVLICWEKIQN